MQVFTCAMSILVAKLVQINGLEDVQLNVPQMFIPFQEKFDKLQDHISALSVLDELLAGKFKVQ